MTYPLTQQIEAVKRVATEKRSTGEVTLADALQAALATLVAAAATAGHVYPGSEQVVVTPVSATLYKQFEEEFQQFCKRETGLAGRMDGGQGRALNEIINYLRANCTNKNDAGALASWKYILRKDNWSKLTPFLQRQKTLTAINKYLLEILEVVRKSAQPAARTWPDEWSANFAAKLDPSEVVAYQAHLRSIGWYYDGQRQRWRRRD